MRKVVILALLCIPADLFGQALHPDSLFPRLIGHWVLRGTIAHEQTVHDVTFAWLLGREYVQMHEVARTPALNGTTYEAVVLFGRDPQTGAYDCMWLDNTAAAAFDDPRGIGRGSVAGDSVPFLFRYTATDSFHTTFVYNRATDSWQWHMDNDSSGVRRPFARVTLTRR